MPSQTVRPSLEVRNVDRQQGDIAVQVDPGIDAKAEGLEHCESVLLERVRDWLETRQAAATALALHYDRPDYRGLVRLVAAQADRPLPDGQQRPRDRPGDPRDDPAGFRHPRGRHPDDDLPAPRLDERQPLPGPHVPAEDGRAAQGRDGSPCGSTSRTR